MPVKSADWDRARTLCPPEEYGSTSWREHYVEHPDILTKMLGDLYRVYKSEESKRNGTANPQGGRRKAHIDGNLDELWSIITPDFATCPFAEAVFNLKGTRSYSQIATRAGMDRRRLSGLLKGLETTVLNRDDIEAVAKALDVHPAYFREWRLAVIQDLVAQIFTASPHLSITAIKELTR